MSEVAPPETIGLFGLGLIGCAIAGRLIEAGLTVRGFDPEPEAMTHLETIGGQPVSADEVWHGSTVLSAVFDTDQLAGLIADAPEGQGGRLVSFSTCDPARIPEIAAAAADKGLDLIEAPISGTSADLAGGNAILLVGGEVSIAADLAPLFEILARAHYHMGAVGNGNRAKLAINLVLGLNRAALAEGIVFAKAVGLDPGRFLELAQVSAAASAVMGSKGPMMVERDFEPLGRITQSAKDFGLIHATATRAGQGLPLAKAYLEILNDSFAHGEEQLDNSAVLLAIERTPPPVDESA